MVKAEELLSYMRDRFNRYYNNAAKFDCIETGVAKMVMDDVENMVRYFDDKDPYKWHDLRKAPEDKPAEGKMVIIAIQGHDVIRCNPEEDLLSALARASKFVRTSVGSVYEENGYMYWCGADGYPVMTHVIAWKEIDHFEGAE